MNRFCRLMGVGVLSVWLAACAGPQGTGMPVSTPVPETPTIPTATVASASAVLAAELSVDEVTAMYQQADVLIVDVREPEEYAEGHIPQATLVPLGQLGEVLPQLDQTKTIVFVCRSGRRSNSALQLAQEKGLTNVHHMAGGMLAWIEAGNPVDK